MREARNRPTAPQRRPRADETPDSPERAELRRKQQDMLEAYAKEDATGGVWVRARGREIHIRDGAGFGAPSKKVTQTQVRWLRHHDAAEYEGNREIVVVGWPAPGAEGSKHSEDYLDVELHEFKPPPDPTPPRSATEVAIARQRDDAKGEADELRRLVGRLQEQLEDVAADRDRIADILTAQDAQAAEQLTALEDMRAEFTALKKRLEVAEKRPQADGPDARPVAPPAPPAPPPPPAAEKAADKPATAKK